MHRLLHRAMLVILAMLSPGAAEQRALLIGINDYIDGSASVDLRGCENDVDLTEAMLLTRFGFEPQQIKVLKSREATRERILEAIEKWLVEGVSEADAVYLHFSGHGSQIRDFDGDEADGLDEVLCPVDVNLSAPIETVITDDELGALLDRIPSRRLTVVLDACHSGTGTRDITTSRPRYLDLTGERSRGLLAPATTPVRSEPPSLVGDGGMDVLAPARVTISGCRADQTAADAWIEEEFYAGALTYHLTRGMGSIDEGTTYGALVDRVARDMAGRFTQIPQVEGDVHSPVQPAEAAPVPAMAILRVEGESVTVRAGRADGLSVGSIASVERGQRAVGQVRVEEVRTDLSLATLLHGEARAGDRLALDLLYVADPGLRVRLEGGESAQRASLTESLAKEGMATTHAGQLHDVTLRLTSGAEIRADLLRDGERLASESAAGVEELVKLLTPSLHAERIRQSLSRIDVARPAFDVKVWVSRRDVELESVAWQPQKLVHARIGDVLTLNVWAERACHLTLVNVGTSGGITVLFPNTYHPSSRIDGQVVYQTGTDAMPFRLRMAGPPGREVIKVIATTQPLDPSWLDGLTGTAPSTAGESPSLNMLSRGLTAVYGPVVSSLAEQSPDAPAAGLYLPAGQMATDAVLIETLPGH